MFEQGDETAMAHITLPQTTDLFLIAPATAHTIAKLASGLADDLLSTAALASTAPVLICPAMNTHMLVNQATQDNLNTLEQRGAIIVEPESGLLACGEVGAGRLARWDSVREAMLGVLSANDLAGEKILITAGPTREPLDPARYLSNRSSGKMGYALARTAKRRGAEVTLISGPVHLEPPPGIELIRIATAHEMLNAVQQKAASSSIIVKAAAVADFTPVTTNALKIKKTGTGMELKLKATTDILAELGHNRINDQIIVGFAAESNNHLAEGKRKLCHKNVDLMVVNDILGKNTGFDVDTNQVTLITENSVQQLKLLSKEETADKIWDKVLALKKGKPTKEKNSKK